MGYKGIMGIRKLRCFMILLMLWQIITARVLGNNFFAHDGLVYTIMTDGKSVVLTDHQASSEFDGQSMLHIPSSVVHEGNRYHVRHIANSALSGLHNIDSISIDEGVLAIGDYAFDCCVNLKSVYIPASVNSIGKGLFGSCYNLTEVKVDAHNECYDSRESSNAIIETDDDRLIAACPATIIPSSIRSIADFAFYHCNTVESLVIPEGVLKIGNNAFSGCSSLKHIVLPQSLLEIGAYVFCACSSMKSVVIPKNVCRIGGANIFQGCNILSSVIVDKENTFYDSRSGCNAIVRSSDSTLVAACRTTCIGEDIKRLDDECFGGLNVHAIRIPRSVVEISETAFNECFEIDTLLVEAGNPSYISPVGSNVILTKDGKVLVLGCRTSEIPIGIEAIGDYAFAGRFSTPVLKLPDGLKSIGWDAFRGCSQICELTIPRSVTSICPYAFSGCGNLKVVQLLSPVEEIPFNTFENCKSLSVLTIAEGVRAIANRAFENCTNLKDVHLPSSVTTVSNEAFLNCPYSNAK